MPFSYGDMSHALTRHKCRRAPRAVETEPLVPLNEEQYTRYSVKAHCEGGNVWPLDASHQSSFRPALPRLETVESAREAPASLKNCCRKKALSASLDEAAETGAASHDGETHERKAALRNHDEGTVA